MPINIGGEHVANFFTGQFFFESPDEEYFLHQAEEFSFDKDSYIAALNKVPIFSEDKVRGMMEFFTRLAQLIGEMGLARNNLGEANRELQEKIAERKQMEGEIERLNTDLAARAAELQAANLELEAFNYSVSHDLRVPLSVISGYTQIIEAVCSDVMGERCKAYLPEISKGVSRMTELIDALLNFSQATHRELRRETFDLSSVAKEIVEELVQVAPERRTTIKLAEGIEVSGDSSLLRIVLGNLLGNAWKYTSQQEEAVIEFGVTTVGKETAYFVRDNGPGFDMADAERLFAPFQRLAGKAEFAGHGIGLATVERIIKRHGGRVWAEGDLGKGAIFYFTLPNGGREADRCR